MNYFYVTLFALTGLMLSAVAVAVVVMAIRNIRRGLRLQNKLETQVDDLRLGQMLAHRGIDVRRYLTRERARNIRQHAINCESCPNLDECDSSLGKAPEATEDYSFCPNDSELQGIAERQTK